MSVRLLDELEYPWIVAIRSNHGVLMPKEQRVKTNRWKAFNQVFSDNKSEVRFSCEIIFGQRRDWRYWTSVGGQKILPAKLKGNYD